MNTAVVNVKVNPKIKKQAQKVAEDLGLSLSSVVNAYLRQLIKTRRVEFSDVRLELTPWAKRMLRESEKDVKAGRVSPSFKNAKDAIAWLNDPIARYENGDPV